MGACRRATMWPALLPLAQTARAPAMKAPDVSPLPDHAVGVVGQVHLFDDARRPKTAMSPRTPGATSGPLVVFVHGSQAPRSGCAAEAADVRWE